LTRPKKDQATKDELSIPEFEKSLQKLEEIVSTMERGEDSLEEALTRFEEGVVLSRKCQQALQTAEQRVRILLEEREKDQARLDAFEASGD